MWVVASWSGGKDGCLACYKAILDGFDVSHLLNLVFKEVEGWRPHGLAPELIAMQAEAMEIPIVQREVTWDTYEEELKSAIRELKRTDIGGGVFGDICIQAHRDWVHRVCGELGIKPIMPLWGFGPERIMADFIDAGFEAIVVVVKADLLSEEWLGRKIDRGFVSDLRKLGNKIHLCGELGEYHTFVTDGPLFKRCLKVLKYQKVLRSGLDGKKYRFLDISRVECVEKKRNIR